MARQHGGTKTGKQLQIVARARVFFAKPPPKNYHTRANGKRLSRGTTEMRRRPVCEWFVRVDTRTTQAP